MVDREGIVVGPESRVPEPAIRLPYGEIQQIELKGHRSSIAKAAAIGARHWHGYILHSVGNAGRELGLI